MRVLNLLLMTIVGALPFLASAETTLADLAAKKNVKIAAFSFSYPREPDSKLKASLTEFNLIILPVFMRTVEPQRGQFDFSMADAVADAAPPGTLFYVPGLAWNDLTPLWIASGKYSGPELERILREFVSTTVRHFETKYPGRVMAWEAALEPLNWQGQPQCENPKDSSKPCGGFWNRIGLDAGLDQYEYIRISARTIRSITPHGKIYVQDFAVEDLGPRAEKYFQLVSQLKSEKIPLDGVGFEGHFMLGSGGAFMQVPAIEVLTTNLHRFGALGLKTMIASVDISIKNNELSPTTLERQAEGYRTLLRACLSQPSCEAFGTWGVGDKDSWIPQYFPGWGSPLLFDTDYLPKPAYRALRDELIR